MSDKLDQTPGAMRRDEGEGAFKRNAIPDDDVEGHSMLRHDDGALRRDEGEGALRRDDEGFSKRVGPGEGHTSRT